MKRDTGKITIFYEGACPICIRDRRRYERLARGAAERIVWFDINGREAQLRARGIDPEKALLALHVMDGRGRILSSIDAYVLLLDNIPLLKPLARLIDLPLVRPRLDARYRRQVRRRLARSGRLPD